MALNKVTTRLTDGQLAAMKAVADVRHVPVAVASRDAVQFSMENAADYAAFTAESPADIAQAMRRALHAEGEKSHTLAEDDDLVEQMISTLSITTKRLRDCATEANNLHLQSISLRCLEASDSLSGVMRGLRLLLDD